MKTTPYQHKQPRYIKSNQKNNSKKFSRKVSTVNKNKEIPELQYGPSNTQDKTNIINFTLNKITKVINNISKSKKGKYHIEHDMVPTGSQSKHQEYDGFTSKDAKTKKTACDLDKTRKTEPAHDINKKVNKHNYIPFPGIVSFFSALNKSNKNDISIKDSCQILLRTNTLLKMCNKPGDAVVLTFSGGTHNSMLVYDENLGAPVYLSFGKMRSFKHAGGGSDDLINDIIDFNDIIEDKNIVKIDGLDTKAMLDKWRSSIPDKKFNMLTRNCSAITKKIILIGAESKIKRKKISNDRVWQMPHNTHLLALEIQHHMKKL